MKLEHVAFQVADPAAMAAWYVRHLGFYVKRAAEEPVVARFLADSSGTVMLEVYRNPDFPVPDYWAIDPIALHVAFLCPDIPAAALRLQAAGATLVRGPETIRSDQFAMLRDPWGLPLQLVLRNVPMIESVRF